MSSPAIERALEAVKKILDKNRKNPRLAADVDHSYGDKYHLVESITNTAIAATLNVLEQLDGFNQDVFEEAIDLVQVQKQSLNLRFQVEEEFEFLKKSSLKVIVPTKWRVVESTTTQLEQHTHHSATSPPSNINTYLATREVQELHWRVGVHHTLKLFPGTDPHSGGIVLGDRTASEHWITTTKLKSLQSKSHPPLDMDLTWLFAQVNQSNMECSFQIERENAKTPRRNQQVEATLEFVDRLLAWAQKCNRYFQHTLKVKPGSEAAQLRRQLRQTDGNSVFMPILPLFQDSHQDAARELIRGQATDWNGIVSLQASPVDSPLVPLNGTVLLLQQQCHSLNVAVLGLTNEFPLSSDQGNHITGCEAKLVLLWTHLVNICMCWKDSVYCVEQMLRSQIIQAIGKELDSKDFDNFLEFHNRRMFPKCYSPKPFCFAIRQPNQYPVGVLSIEKVLSVDNGEVSDSAPISTFARFIPGGSLSSPMSIPLNASTTVEFGGGQYLHGWMASFFEGEKPQANFIRARARQFSCFLMMTGSITGPSEFTPKDAILLQDGDELIIPLLSTALPSAKEFRDAIQSISPEQARFAKSFRAMQLDSSVFGLCVIQIQPQMEALLNLPQTALNKEIQLFRDVVSLFVDYQIPPNLLCFDGDATVTTAEKVAAVKQHARCIMDAIHQIQDMQLEAQRKKADEMKISQASLGKRHSADPKRRCTWSFNGQTGTL